LQQNKAHNLIKTNQIFTEELQEVLLMVIIISLKLQSYMKLKK